MRSSKLILRGEPRMDTNPHESTWILRVTGFPTCGADLAGLWVPSCLRVFAWDLLLLWGLVKQLPRHSKTNCIHVHLCSWLAHRTSLNDHAKARSREEELRKCWILKSVSTLRLRVRSFLLGIGIRLVFSPSHLRVRRPVLITRGEGIKKAFWCHHLFVFIRVPSWISFPI